jgi:CheY-like chemotaxis protein
MPELFYIDDSRDDLFYLEYIRKKDRIDVALFCFSQAETAFVALKERLEKNEALPDLLIADLYMPLEGGLALVTDLSADIRFAGMKLGICSGSDAIEDRERVLAAGADFYLEKPVNLADIVHNQKMYRTKRRFPLL